MAAPKQPLNWLRVINAFYDYTAAHPITPRAAAMYHYMLYIFSRSRWAEWVTLGNMQLAAGCNMSVASVKRARAELVELGLIDYETAGANRHAMYRLRAPRLWFDQITPQEVDDVRRQISDSLGIEYAPDYHDPIFDQPIRGG